MNVSQIIVAIHLLFLLMFSSCNDKNSSFSNPEKQHAIESMIMPDSVDVTFTAIKQRFATIEHTLQQETPILLLENLSEEQSTAQQIAISDSRFKEFIFDKETRKPFRNEIFNIYPARPQEVGTNFQQGKVFKVEMYNFALNMTTTAMVDIVSKQTISINSLKATQPDIPQHLKDLALQIATHNPEVIKALGYQPGEEEALMANTKTALNNTKCERSLHLCVAPTFTKGDKALWAIVDLTDHKLVGIRWTNTGTEQPSRKLSEKRLKFDKVMECYCKKITALEKGSWKLNYVITTSDGLRISEVKYKDELILNNAKVVDWHVNYSNTDHFGYSDAVGCPEFSQAAVVAVSDPKVSDIIKNGEVIGFALEQNFSSEQWPFPCNYNYLQRYEFYNDGRWRSAAASLGRGCGNNGTYRPVMRFSFPSNENRFNQFNGNSWDTWKTEQWKLQTSQTPATKDGYEYQIIDKQNKGFYIESGKGQFNDGGRGDNPFIYVTKNHPNIDEGENDLVTIGPCCNTDYQQGPEKFINNENIENTSIVLWYVSQMKNEDTKGKEYCWCERYLENGVYKTHVYPCISGPMFVPTALNSK